MGVGFDLLCWGVGWWVDGWVYCDVVVGGGFVVFLCVDKVF